MKPRQIVHLLLIISEAIIIACCLFMIIKYNRKGWNRKIWMGSKILTMKNEMKTNNYYLYPLFRINRYGENEEYPQNYEYLLKHSGKECEKNYKKCGILDTYGNIMCIPNEDECPINDIIIDLSSKNKEYLSKGYKNVHLESLEDDYDLYYTNKEIDKEIVVKMVFSDEIPRYINEDNFIFDYDTYHSSISRGSGGDGGSDSDYGGGGGDYGGGDGGGGGGDIGSGGGGFRNLLDTIYGDSEITSYIEERLDEDINIDKSYKYISDDLYVGNYIGFKDYSHMNDFNDMNLYKSYFNIFPNLASYVFCYFSIIFLVILIICSIVRFCHKDVPNEGFDSSAVSCAKILIILPYSIIFIGYYIYIIYEFIKIYTKRNPENLIKIKTVAFIEDLLDEIYKRNLKKIFIIMIIILFSCSLILFIFAWILSHIFTKRYIKFLKNCQPKMENSDYKINNP